MPWMIPSAEQAGASHKRKRWFMLCNLVRDAAVEELLLVSKDMVACGQLLDGSYSETSTVQGLPPLIAKEKKISYFFYNTFYIGCDAGTPFMFNFTNPSMPGLPILPDGNMPFGANWTAPLLPGLPPKPLYGNSFN